MKCIPETELESQPESPGICSKKQKINFDPDHTLSISEADRLEAEELKRCVEDMGKEQGELSKRLSTMEDMLKVILANQRYIMSKFAKIDERMLKRRKVVIMEADGDWDPRDD